jgi:hypothetical protein
MDGRGLAPGDRLLVTADNEVSIDELQKAVEHLHGAVMPAAAEPPADALVPRPATAFVFALLALAALASCSSSSGGRRVEPRG